MERLCAEDHLGTELVREIEAVIFSYTDPTDTLNASNFEELRTLRTQSIREGGDRLRSDTPFRRKDRLVHPDPSGASVPGSTKLTVPSDVSSV